MGAGYAVLLVPEKIKDLSRKVSPNLIVKPFGNETIGEGDFEEVKTQIEKSDSIAIGMGIGRSEESLEMARKIIDYAVSKGKKLVVDADAIYAIGKAARLNKNVAVTPQEKEFVQLYGEEESKELNERVSQAVALANSIGATVVAKGHTTIITNGKLLRLNTAETSALATMGTGDVLSGIIAGYAATGAVMLDACAAGVYLHSRAGDLLALEKGTHIIAEDLIDIIPKIIKAYDKRE